MAWEYANRCADVTPEMVTRLVSELQARKINYIVAPYEADAQMAFLVKNGLADAVISEDSDMLLFGCPQVKSVSFLAVVCFIYFAFIFQFGFIAYFSVASIMQYLI